MKRLLLCLILGCSGTTTGIAPLPDGGAPPLDGGREQTAEPSCSVDAIQKIQVRDDGLYGYPPYSAWGCQLAYVTPSGDLVLRDLATAREEILATKADSPRRPTLAGDTIAWERGPADRPEIVVRRGTETTGITGAFKLGAEPRAASGAVAFTGFKDTLKGDSDVYLYDVATKALERLTDGPAQERFADVSATHVAWTDFTEDPDGRFDEDGRDLSDVVVYDRVTKTRVSRQLPGKQAFPVLASGSVLGYLDWAAIHPEPKFEAYVLRAGDLTDTTRDRDVATIRSVQTILTRPAGRSGVFEWVDHPENRTRWLRAPADGSAAPVEVQVAAGLELYAPQAARTFSVVATRAVTGTTSPDVFLALVGR